MSGETIGGNDMIKLLLFNELQVLSAVSGTFNAYHNARKWEKFFPLETLL